MHLWCGCVFMRCQNGFLFIIRLENNYSNGCGIVYIAHYSYIFHMFFAFLAKDEKEIYKYLYLLKERRKVFDTSSIWMNMMHNIELAILWFIFNGIFVVSRIWTHAIQCNKKKFFCVSIFSRISKASWMIWSWSLWLKK